MITDNYIIPTVIEKFDNIEKSYDIYSRLLLDRIVFVAGEIEDNMANAICAQLLFLQAQDPDKQVNMYVNSPGGAVTAGLAIIDTMKYIKCPIATYCMGQAASMGAVILSNGNKGKRYALPNSRIMIHQPSSGIERSKISDIEISYKEGQRLKDILNQILAKNCNKDVNEIEKATDRDNFMSAIEAKDFGLIDNVL